MTFVVFVTAIVKEGGQVVASAANGGLEGPPLISWTLPSDEVSECFIGKKYRVTVEAWGNG